MFLLVSLIIRVDLLIVWLIVVWLFYWMFVLECEIVMILCLFVWSWEVRKCFMNLVVLLMMI